MTSDGTRRPPTSDHGSARMEVQPAIVRGAPPSHIIVEGVMHPVSRGHPSQEDMPGLEDTIKHQITPLLRTAIPRYYLANIEQASKPHTRLFDAANALGRRPGKTSAES